MQVQAQQTIADSVLKNTYLLIEALKDNYRQYAIRGHQKFVDDADTHEYHVRRIDELKAGDCSIDYQVETGKKYHKVIFIDGRKKSIGMVRVLAKGFEDRRGNLLAEASVLYMG